MKRNKKKNKYAGWFSCFKKDCIRNYDGNRTTAKPIAVLQANGWGR